MGSAPYRQTHSTQHQPLHPLNQHKLVSLWGKGLTRVENQEIMHTALYGTVFINFPVPQNYGVVALVPVTSTEAMVRDESIIQ